MTTALTRHLAAWLGAWQQATDGLDVIPSATRDEPTWDGAVRPLIGAVRPDGGGTIVTSPALHEEVSALVAGRRIDELDRAARRAIGERVHGDGAVLGVGVLRWIAHDELDGGVAAIAPDVAPLGTWIDHADESVPAWLRPFGGDVLLALDDDGGYAAGVGIKRHDATGHELAVVTDERHRGRGLARRLVATAARSVLDDVPVATYLHATDNTGSARVADAVGFRDRGWRVLGVFGGEAPG